MNAILVLAAIVSISLANLSYAQSAPPAPAEAAVTFPIKLQMIREPLDEKGTDTTNIYTIQVDYAGPKGVVPQPCTIIYFLDDRFEEEFKNQALPFFFRRDFKGQLPGQHVIRIEIEDAKENNLATATLDINTKSPRREKTNRIEMTTDK